MGLERLIKRYGGSKPKSNWYRLKEIWEEAVIILRILEHHPHFRIYDEDQQREYDTEAYRLEGGIFLVYEYQQKRWLDRNGKEYKEAVSDGEIVGFIG